MRYLLRLCATFLLCDVAYAAGADPVMGDATSLLALKKKLADRPCDVICQRKAFSLLQQSVHAFTTCGRACLRQVPTISSNAPAALLQKRLHRVGVDSVKTNLTEWLADQEGDEDLARREVLVQDLENLLNRYTAEGSAYHDLETGDYHHYCVVKEAEAAETKQQKQKAEEDAETARAFSEEESANANEAYTNAEGAYEDAKAAVDNKNEAISNQEAVHQQYLSDHFLTQDLLTRVGELLATYHDTDDKLHTAEISELEETVRELQQELRTAEGAQNVSHAEQFTEDTAARDELVETRDNKESTMNEKWAAKVAADEDLKAKEQALLEATEASKEADEEFNAAERNCNDHRQNFERMTGYESDVNDLKEAAHHED